MYWFTSTLPTAIFAAFAAAAAYAGLCVLIWNKPPTLKATALAAAFAGYAYFIVYITILSRAQSAFAIIELNPLASYFRASNTRPHLARIEIRNAMLNIVMLLPLGVLLPVAHCRFRRLFVVTATGFATSLAIEISQLITRRGIFATEDILHNTLGAALGYAIYKIFAKFIKKS